MDFKPTKKLGFGMMRMPLIDKTNDADVDVEQVSRSMIRLSFLMKYLLTILRWNLFSFR
ncbi:hypothetical protein [Butyrivibrio sp. FC2001]|uniref:hypothetical protein n=1 Tax=Butyrivibrio sp. FC2001 TaxID=1280671 RepID=UPI0012DC6D51|nr:hypothetical protein [Butyrivibrio sp. FC2001]